MPFITGLNLWLQWVGQSILGAAAVLIFHSTPIKADRSWISPDQGLTGVLNGVGASYGWMDVHNPKSHRLRGPKGNAETN